MTADARKARLSDHLLPSGGRTGGSTFQYPCVPRTSFMGTSSLGHLVTHLFHTARYPCDVLATSHGDTGLPWVCWGHVLSLTWSSRLRCYQ